MGLINQTNELYYEGADGIWNSGDENYGDYQFTSLDNIIGNFMIAYVSCSNLVSPSEGPVVTPTQNAFLKRCFAQRPKWIRLKSAKCICDLLPSSGASRRSS